MADQDRASGRERRRWARRRTDRERVRTDPGERPRAVLIAGIGSTIGRGLTRLLHRSRRVVGVDEHPFSDRPKDVEHFELDPRSSKIRDLVRQAEVGAVVYLGLVRERSDPRADDYERSLAGFQKLLELVREQHVPKLVLLSSAAVYGPRPDNPQFLREEAPLLGGGKPGDLGELTSIDLLAQSFFWKHTSTETVILRPVHVLGPLDNAPSRYLRLGRVPTVLGYDPMIQVMHVGDVVAALERALLPGMRGIFNLAGPQPCSLSEALHLLGRGQFRLPHPLARFGIERLFRWRLTEHAAPELDFLRYVCMVDDQRAREVLGYHPRHGLSASLEAVDEERWV
jgi:UDP-glucose 4-epimerase